MKFLLLEYHSDMEKHFKKLARYVFKHLKKKEVKIHSSQLSCLIASKKSIEIVKDWRDVDLVIKVYPLADKKWIEIWYGMRLIMNYYIPYYPELLWYTSPFPTYKLLYIILLNEKVREVLEFKIPEWMMEILLDLAPKVLSVYDKTGE